MINTDHQRVEQPELATYNYNKALYCFVLFKCVFVKPQSVPELWNTIKIIKKNYQSFTVTPIKFSLFIHTQHCNCTGPIKKRPCIIQMSFFTVYLQPFVVRHSENYKNKNRAHNETNINVLLSNFLN